VVCVFSGDYGKPRPAVVVQSDLFNGTHASIVVCPISSEVTGLDLFRISLEPSSANGLRKASEVMIDKLGPAGIHRIRRKIGRLSAGQMSLVDRALRLWLDLPVKENNL